VQDYRCGERLGVAADLEQCSGLDRRCTRRFADRSGNQVERRSRVIRIISKPVIVARAIRIAWKPSVGRIRF
jgi:hypothetical protein